MKKILISFVFLLSFLNANNIDKIYELSGTKLFIEQELPNSGLKDITFPSLTKDSYEFKNYDFEMLAMQVKNSIKQEFSLKEISDLLSLLNSKNYKNSVGLLNNLTYKDNNLDRLKVEEELLKIQNDEKKLNELLNLSSKSIYVQSFARLFNIYLSYFKNIVENSPLNIDNKDNIIKTINEQTNSNAKEIVSILSMELAGLIAYETRNFTDKDFAKISFINKNPLIIKLNKTVLKALTITTYGFLIKESRRIYNIKK